MTGPRRNGIVLVLISGLLVLLAATAMTFLRVAGSMRLASGTQAQEARACLLARSGVERALQGTVRNPVPGPKDFETDWRWRDATDRPLADARNPSFHHRRLEPWLDDGNGTFDGEGYTDLDDNGRYSGFSGRLRGALSATGDTYTLKVEDESAKINVNGGFLDTQDRDGDTIPDHRDPDVRQNPADPKDTGRGWNFQLARILNVLGTAREDWDGDSAIDPGEDWDGDGALDPAPIGIPGMGAAILAGRPAGGYGSVAQVQDTLGTTIDLTPYLTVSSWIDRAVVHPTAHQALPSSDLSEFMMNRAPTRVEEQGRPPVNLNEAPGIVLASLLSDLRAIGWSAGHAYLSMFNDRLPRVVSAILARRRTDPYDTWGEFSRHSEEMAQGSAALWAHTGDLLNANFNPNTMLAKHVPDRLVWRRCDKTDLEVWSTEGSLHPTGVFRVRSLGRVADPRGAPATCASVDAGIGAYRLLRQTTQEEFVAGRVPDAGPASYLTISDGTARTHGAGAAWNAWGAGRGLTACTYPAPMTALPGNAASIDGRIALATTELEPLDMEPGKPLLFLHHFDDSWDAETVSGGGPPARDPAVPEGARLQSDVGAPVWPDTALPLPQREPNTLVPDGIRGDDSGRAAAFAAAGNLPAFSGSPPGNRGVLSYWVKIPSVALGAPGSDYHVECRRGTGAATHTMATGHYYGVWGVLAENGVFGSDPSHEQESEVRFDGATIPNGPSRLWGLRWALVTAAFDTNETDKTLQTWFRADERPDRPPSAIFRARYGVALDPSTSQDLLADDCRLRVGTVEGVLDEFATYDAGDDAAAAQVAAGILHDARRADGRYYKGDDAAFLSAVLAPAPGAAARLRWVRWTAYLPRDTTLDVLDNSTPGVPTHGTYAPPDPSLLRARVEIDLVDDADPTSIVVPSLAHGGDIDLARAAFRYRVRFLNGLMESGLDPLNTGVLESPWFDDITFAWQGAAGPDILAWVER